MRKKPEKPIPSPIRIVNELTGDERSIGQWIKDLFKRIKNDNNKTTK